MRIKTFLAAAVCAFSFMSPAVAQVLPDRPVRLVVAYPPGGSMDPVARALATGLSKRIGQSVIVENKPGGNTVIATQYVANAPADGSVLYFTLTTPYTMVPHMLKRKPYDPTTAMTPVAQVGEMLFAFAVTQNSPFTTLKELVDAAKASPGKLSFPTPGIAQTIGLTSELFKTETGIDALHVPYTGSGPAVTALLSGHHDFFIADIGSVDPFVKSGKLRLLSTVGNQRLRDYPNVPTLDESGYKDIVIPAAWIGIVAPPGMDDHLVMKLNELITAEMQTPEMQRVMQSLMLNVATSSPGQLATYLKQDDEAWGALIRKLGVSID